MNRAYRRAWEKAQRCIARVSKIPAGVRAKISDLQLRRLLTDGGLEMNATGQLWPAAVQIGEPGVPA